MEQATNTTQFEDEDTQTGKFLTFMLGTQAYGLEVQVVIEIIRLQDITPVPDVPDYIRGIINLRGRVIPVMDVRKRFHMEPREYDARTCIVVVQVEAASVGLVVDTVSEVVDIHDEEIEPPPRVSTTSEDPVIQGIGKVGDEVKILLDATRLLQRGDLSQELTSAL